MIKKCKAQSAKRRVKSFFSLLISILILISFVNCQAIIKTKSPAAPNAPILNSLTYSDSAVTLNYYTDSKTDYIEIYQASQFGNELTMNWELVDSSSSSPAVLPVVPGQEVLRVFIYAIAYDTSAADPYRMSANSNTVNVSIDPVIPGNEGTLAAPTASGISQIDGLVTVYYSDNSTAETGFRLYRGTNSDGSGRTVVSTMNELFSSGLATSITNTPTAGFTYYYWVSAYNDDDELFSHSLVINIPAPPPAALAFTNGLFSDGTTTGWSVSNSIGGAVYSFANSSNAGLLQVTTVGTNTSRPMIWAYLNGYYEAGQEYNVQFDITVNSGATELYAVYTNGVVGNHTDLTSGTYHFNYTFIAINANVFGCYFDGTSLFSISLDNFILTKNSTGLAVPTGLTGTASYTSVALSWNAVSGATGYLLEHKLQSGSTWTQIRNQTATTYTHTGLDSLTGQNYRVRAYDATDTTAYSSILAITTLGAVSATNYYISSSIGSDANNGRSPASPWKTFANLGSSFWNNLHPGDSVLFRRGDSWSRFAPDNYGRLTIGQSTNEATLSGVTVGAYGTGAKPLITDIDTRVGFKDCVIENLQWNWVRLFVSPYVYVSGSPPLQVVRYTARYDIDGVIFQDNISDGNFEFGNFYAPSQIPLNNQTRAELGSCKNLVLRRNIFQNSSYDGANLTGCGDSVQVYDNIFRDNPEDGLDIPGGKGHKIYRNKFVGMGANGLKLHSQFSPLYDYQVYGNFFLKCGTGNAYNSAGYALALENTWGGKIFNNTIASTLSTFLGNRDRTQVEGYYGNFEENEYFNNIECGSKVISGTWGIITDWDYVYQLSPTPQTATSFVSVAVSPQIDMKFRSLSDSSMIYILNDFHHNSYYSGSGQGFPQYGYLIRWLHTNNYPDDYASYIDSRSVDISDVSKFTTDWLNHTDATEAYRNPLFVSPGFTDYLNYGDYRLLSGSSENNSGAAVTGLGYTIDLNGNAVNQSSPDRGCFQN